LWSDEEQVSVIENEMLIKEFAEEEINDTLYQMDKNKAEWFSYWILSSMLAFFEIGCSKIYMMGNWTLEESVME
jgi:hypothetical protein